MSGPAREWLDRELETIVSGRVHSDRGAVWVPEPGPPHTFTNATTVNATGSYGRPSNGFNGPPLTDADVRRLERGEL